MAGAGDHAHESAGGEEAHAIRNVTARRRGGGEAVGTRLA